MDYKLGGLLSTCRALSTWVVCGESISASTVGYPNEYLDGLLNEQLDERLSEKHGEQLSNTVNELVELVH